MNASPTLLYVKTTRWNPKPVDMHIPPILLGDYWADQTVLRINSILIKTSVYMIQHIGVGVKFSSNVQLDTRCTWPVEIIRRGKWSATHVLPNAVERRVEIKAGRLFFRKGGHSYLWLKSSRLLGYLFPLNFPFFSPSKFALQLKKQTRKEKPMTVMFYRTQRCAFSITPLWEIVYFAWIFASLA